MDLTAGLTQVLDDGTHVYIYGLGRIAQLEAVSLSTDYFLTDALGSVRQLADSSGTITYSQSYAPFGEPRDTGSPDTSFGFTGEFTESTGMVYLRARFYNPVMGRFTTPDTWEGNYNQPMSYNAWLYGYGNPVMYTDPTGYRGRCPGKNCARFVLPDHYGISFTTANGGEWSDEDKSAVIQAVEDVAHRFYIIDLLQKC